VRRVWKNTGTALGLFVLWYLILWYLMLSQNITRNDLGNALIAAVVVLFGYWFIVTGRLSRLFRKV
jgi:hypothetical protein